MTAAHHDFLAGEEGSAIVEFIFLSVLLMIPVVYLVLTLGQLQGGAYAVVGAADQAAKVYVGNGDESGSQQAAEQAVILAVEDMGFAAADAQLQITCAGDCSAPGSVIHATVRLRVPLPIVSALPGVRLDAAIVEASATQKVGRYR